MKKNLVLIFLALFFSSLSYGQDLSQDPELKAEIEDLADLVGNKLMNCCSTWGGKSLSTTVYWGQDSNGKYQTRMSQLTKRLTVTMKVQWYGSITGTRYWIKGKVVMDLESGRREWIKISDSGGFSPGCGRDCNVN